jgi:hypothetical protein
VAVKQATLCLTSELFWASLDYFGTIKVTKKNTFVTTLLGSMLIKLFFYINDAVKKQQCYIRPK